MPRPALALAIALAAGCAGPPLDLTLGWRFADGRTCADSGAATVYAFADGAALDPRTGFPCPDGEPPRTVHLSLPAEADLLTLEARTSSGTPLYRGDAPTPFVTPLTIPLYFTAGAR